MRDAVANHLGSVTVGLTVISIVLVVAASMQAIPDVVLPDGPAWLFEAIPHVNALLAVGALAAIASGIRAIKAGRIDHHRRSMLLALLAFLTFLVLYLLNVAATGPAPFEGPDALYRFLYLPLLAVHITLAVICLPLLYYVVLLATTRPVSAIPRTAHARVARPAVVLWSVSFVLGLAVYGLVHLLY